MTFFNKIESFEWCYFIEFRRFDNLILLNSVIRRTEKGELEIGINDYPLPLSYPLCKSM